MPGCQWEIYKTVFCPDDSIKSTVALKVIHERPQAVHEPGVREERQYQVTVEVCLWCDLVVEGPTKRAAIHRAASMYIAGIPSKWDGYTSAGTAGDDLEPGF